MTSMFSNLFTGRLIAAAFALVLSAAMVAGSVGPALNVPAAAAAQGYIA